MPIITLTSDWGQKDHYAGAVKGAILTKMPEATIVDISHQIPPFEIEQAAFVLKNAWRNFPKGTVHIIGVNTEESDKFGHTVVEKDGHFFIGTDNGFFRCCLISCPIRSSNLPLPRNQIILPFQPYIVLLKLLCTWLQENR